MQSTGDVKLQRRYVVVAVELSGDTVVCSLMEQKTETPEPDPVNREVTTIQELEKRGGDDDMKRMAETYFEAAVKAMPFLAGGLRGGGQVSRRPDMMYRFTVEEWEELGRPGLFSELVLCWSAPSL